MITGGRGGSRVSLRPAIEGAGVLTANRTDDGNLLVCTASDEVGRIYIPKLT